MKSRLVAGAALLGTLAATPVLADEGGAPAAQVAATSAPAEARRPLTLSAQLELLPVGNLDLRTSGQVAGHTRPDTRTAYAIGGLATYDVTPNVSLGLAPRLILGIGADSDDARHDTKELDLRARLAVQGEAWNRVHVYGYAAPGYTRLIPAHGDGVDGFTIGFGTGVAFDLTARIFISAEVGYQLAYFSDDYAVQTESGAAPEHADQVVSYAHLGLGGGMRF